MLAALLATSLVALAASAGLFGSGNPGKPVSDVPAVSRSLVQRAIIELPQRQHLQVLAYSRRLDELARLRELPASPVRAVVEYAEHAQKASDDAPPAETAGASAPGEPALIANAQLPVPATTSATQIAIRAAIHVATPSAALSDVLSLPAAAVAAPPAAGDTDVALIETGPEATEAATASDQQKPKRRHGLHVRRARPRTARVTTVPPPRRILPQAETGFPIDAPKAPAPTWPPTATAPIATRTAQAPTQFQDRSKDTTLDTRVDGGR